MKFIIPILAFFIFSQTLLANNPYWVHLDKKLIKSIVELNKNNPKAVEAYFMSRKPQEQDIAKEKLGFGWEMWKSSAGGGYIGITSTFIYYRDSIVSYTITPQMPDPKRLLRRYKFWYKKGFEFKKNQILPFSYREEEILQPLKEYQGVLTSKIVSRKILDYMTPHSGTLYGYSGGLSNSLLENRKAFLQIKDSLSRDQIVFMMYAINPASRLTAFEYYLKNKEIFIETQIIDNWLEENLIEIPNTKTLIGCTKTILETRNLLYMYARY